MAVTASIQNKVNAIRSARLGNKVRDSIADAIDEMDTTLNAAIDAQNERVTQAEANYAEKAAQFSQAEGQLRDAETMQQQASDILTAVTNITATVEPQPFTSTPDVSMSYDASKAQFKFKLPRAPQINEVIGVTLIGQLDTPYARYSPSTGGITLGIPATAKATSAFAQTVPYDEENDKLGEPDVSYDPTTGKFLFKIPAGKPGSNVSYLTSELDKRTQAVLLWESETNFDDPVVQYGEQVILTDEGKLEAYDAVLVEFQTLLNNYYAKSKKVTTARPVRDLVYALVYPDTSTMAYYYKQKADVAPSPAASLSRRVRMIRNVDFTVSGTIHHRGIYFGHAWVTGVTGTAETTSIGYKSNSKKGLPADCCMIPKRIFGITNITKLSADGTIIGINEEVSG